MTTSTDAVDAETPLNPAELQVLRAQYEKEGEMVGVQTKFNYAWVCIWPLLATAFLSHAKIHTYIYLYISICTKSS